MRQALLSRARPNLDLLVLALVFAVVVFFSDAPLVRALLPEGTPLGIVALGTTAGAALALQAMGMVLVMRATRVINFAQASLGAIGGLLFFELALHNELAILVKTACAACLPRLNDDTAYYQSHPDVFRRALESFGYHGYAVASFWLALAIGLLVTPLLSWIAYMLVVRRFDNSPRLVVAVATVVVANVLGAIAGVLPTAVFRDASGDTASLNPVFPIPDIHYSVAARFPWDHHAVVPYTIATGPLATVAVAVVACLVLGAFLTLTRTGTAMRAVADNPQRAPTLGIAVSSLASLSWALAGALSGIGAILVVLSTHSLGIQGGGLDVQALVLIFAAAAFARFQSLPLAVLAATGIEIVGQVLLWNFTRPAPFQVTLLLLILAAFILQRARQSRAEQDATIGFLAAREARPIPPELRKVPVVDAWIRWLLLAGAAVLIAFPFLAPPGPVSGGTVTLIYCLVGLSILVLTGWAGQISLGQFAFAGVGAYVTAVLQSHVGGFFLVNIVVGGMAGAAASMLVGIPAIRLRGLYLGVTTMAFALACSGILLGSDYLGRFLPSSIDRPELLGFQLSDEKVFYYLCLVMLGLAIVAVVGMRRGRTARVLIGARDNEAAAQSFSVSLVMVRLEAFAVAGFIAAFAGGLFAYHERGVEPQAFDPSVSVNLFLSTVVGGLGHWVGPVLGQVFLFSLNLVPGPLGPLVAVAGPLIILVILLLVPGGLAELVFKARDGMLRRVAIRHRILVPSLLADLKAGSLDSRAEVAPNPEYEPVRYRLEGQWEAFVDGGLARRAADG